MARSFTSISFTKERAMMNKRVWAALCFLLLAVGSCKQENGQREQRNKVELKRNAVCNEGVLCLRASFWLDAPAKDEKLAERMDKELSACFFMLSGKDTLAPIVVERVNYGTAEQLVYVVYFEEKEKAATHQIYYNDRFFGLKQLLFTIE